MTESPAVPSAEVTVTGVGRVQVRPDTVVLNLGVRAVRPSPTEALDACSSGLQAVLDALRASATTARSAGLSVRPEVEPREGRREVTGYVAEARIVAQGDQPDQVGEVAAAALLAAGDAGVVHGMDFVVGDTAGAESKARERAFEDARSKAEHYAALAGLSLGRLRELTEGTASGEGRRKFARAAAAGPMPVEPGDLDLALLLVATWELVE
ncbi:MAG: SIMPL domain-containing protein [Actinomycetota bacterium]|nr:SIMPL domain-containing protein [Actinomycetota bacterium]